LVAAGEIGAQVGIEIYPNRCFLSQDRKHFTVLQIVPKLDPGGAERSAIEIAQALVQAGHHAVIVAAPGRWSEWARRVGAELIPMPIGRKHPLALIHIWRLRQLFLTRRIDIVHSRSRLPSWLTWLALKLTPIAYRPRWVTTVHGLHSVGRYSAIQHAGELAIAVSATTRAHVLANYRNMTPEKLLVIPRGADTTMFYPGQNTAAWSLQFSSDFPNARGRKLLLLAGRGTRLKGHEQALELLAELRRQGQDVVLFFAGVVETQRLSYVDTLKQKCERLQLSAHVIFSAARDDLPALYAHAALVLQLSNRPESFGRTVAEALLCGAKVLGLDHGGVGEQLRTAFPLGLVPPQDQAALLARALALLESDVQAELSQVPTLVQMQEATLQAYGKLLAQC
jgi:glycosyltransferase involved in cell wall biosynthesis